jgi:hypothetical protein
VGVLFTAQLLFPTVTTHAQVSATQSTSPSASSVGAAPSPSEAPESYQPPPAIAAKAIAYSSAQHHLYFFDFAYGLLILIVILECRIAPRYRNWAERATPRRLLQAALYAPLLLLTIDIVSLPSSIWAHCLDREFQQSIEGWGPWLLDWLKGACSSRFSWFGFSTPFFAEAQSVGGSISGWRRFRF